MNDKNNNSNASRSHSEPESDSDADMAAVVSTTAAARQLGVSVRTIQLWVESGRLVAWKTAGNHRRIFQWSIDQYQKEEGVLLTPEGNASAHKGSTILVIEDDRTTQVYYETMLQLLSLDDDIQFAADGIEGLVAIGRYQPWLIILDIDMPRLNGIEVVKTLERQNVVAEIALIVISNVPHADALARGLPADTNFHSKPVSLDDFQGAIASERAKSQMYIETNSTEEQ